jgi:6-phosphogluconolactonase
MTKAGAIRILADAASVAAAAADLVIDQARSAVGARGVFDLCSTGGSTPAALYAALREPERSARMPWSATRVWFGDDRWVPRGDARSNLVPVDAVLLASAADGTPSPLRPTSVHPWPTTLESPDATASAYLAELTEANIPHTTAGFPVFDLVLIGIGGDCHCLSVFPGSPLAEAGAPAASGVPAPTHIEPHVARVSFSLGLLSAARAVCAIAPGTGKATALATIIDSDGPFSEAPARAALIPTATWIIDAAAAAQLTKRR